MRDRSAIDFAEIASRLDLSDEEWLAALAALADAIFAETDAPTRAAIFHSDSQGSSVVQQAYTREDPDFVAAVARLEFPRHAWMRAIDRDVTRCNAASDLAGSVGLSRGAVAPLLSGFLGDWGVNDVFNLQGAAFNGYSVGIAIGLGSGCAMDRRRRRTWERVAAHLGAGIRVRRAAVELAGGRRDMLGMARAVFDMEGRELHLDEDLSRGAPRDGLRRAAEAVVEARTRSGREAPEQALSAWRSLFDGEFSIVETHDTDSKALLIAVENQPDIRESSRLTRRERQVTELAAKGESDALIAYELGLDESTVRTHLRRALAKTGLRSRLGLIRAAAVLFGSRDRDGDTPSGQG